VRELELLQEAGFLPMEVLRAGTSHAADLLGIGEEAGVLEVGRRADVLVHRENPLADFKLLHGTGATRLNDELGVVEQKRALEYTIRSGVVFDVDELLGDVRAMVAATWKNGETPYARATEPSK